MKDNPEVKKIWWTALVVYLGRGILNGMFLYVWGPLFYDNFSMSVSAESAIVITMVLFAIRQTLVALLEVPVGALADTIGRAQVTILSQAIFCAFFVCLAALSFTTDFIPVLIWASLASLCYALGYCFFNGAFSAWSADILKERSPQTPYAWLASRFHWYLSFGELFGAVLSIFFYLQDLPFVAFIVGAILAYSLMGFSMKRMEEPKIVISGHRPKISAAELVRKIFERMKKCFQVVRQTQVIKWVVLTYGSFMFLMSLIVHLWPVYLKSTAGVDKLSVEWIVVAVITLVVQIVGGKFFVSLNDRMTSKSVGSRTRFKTYRIIYVGTSILSSVSVFVLSGLAFKGDIPLYALVTVISLVLFCWSIMGSCFDILVNSYIGKEHAKDRATVFSSGSMVRSFLTLLFSIPAGGFSAQESPVGWSIPAVLLLIAAIGTHFAIIKDEKQRAVKVSTNQMEPQNAT